MNVGRAYRLSEFIIWTRRRIYVLFILSAVPVALYQLLHFKWLAFPWIVIAFLGTAASIIVGFKNTQTYNRTGEAQQIWTSIASSSRYWGLISRDFLTDRDKARELIYRHLAWLTALRFQMRRSRPWESTHKRFNAEYNRKLTIPENSSALETEIEKYLTADACRNLLQAKLKATKILDLQSRALTQLYETKDININMYFEMEKSIKEFSDHQARLERIKNFPYPRQYSIINSIFIWVFCALLPIGMISEFDKLNQNVTGFMHGHMVWLVIPMSVMISWIYASLEQVGDSTENPFEGSANDVPISQISRSIEIELREMLDETDLPRLMPPVNNIIM